MYSKHMSFITMGMSERQANFIKINTKIRSYHYPLIPYHRPYRVLVLKKPVLLGRPRNRKQETYSMAKERYNFVTSFKPLHTRSCLDYLPSNISSCDKSSSSELGTALVQKSKYHVVHDRVSHDSLISMQIAS